MEMYLLLFNLIMVCGGGLLIGGFTLLVVTQDEEIEQQYYELCVWLSAVMVLFILLTIIKYWP